MPDRLDLQSNAACLLHPCPPFHFDGTVYKPSYFPGPDLIYEPGHIWHSLRFEGRPYGIRMDNLGSIEEPLVRLTVFSAAPPETGLLERIAAEMVCRYDLQADLRPFYDGLKDDDLLGPVLQRWRGVRPSTYSSLYEYLVIATLLQNATVRRTVQMSENLFRQYGDWLEYDGRVLAAFWEPGVIEAAADEDLRALKVGYRAKSLNRQAASFGSGGLDEKKLREMASPELKKTLLSIYGIGPASVWYLMFGQFKRYDAFEVVSPWEQKIFSRLLFDQELVDGRVILAEVDRRWGKWKMLAAHLLFEDLFWRHRNQPEAWLAELIRL